MVTLAVTRRLDAQQDACGETAFDIYLNARACWPDLPARERSILLYLHPLAQARGSPALW